MGMRREARPALFLDRDGVLVEEVSYLRSPGDLRVLPGIGETICLANASSIPVVLATNQSGIARGYFDWEAFAAVQDRLHSQLAQFSAHLDAVYACGYHPGGAVASLTSEHFWRKPGPGMLEAAARDLAIDLTSSWIVGDRSRDLEAGRAAGLAGGILVATGYGHTADERLTARGLVTASFRVDHAPGLAAAWPALESQLGTKYDRSGSK